MYGSILANSSVSLNGIAVSACPMRLRSYLLRAPANFSRNSVIPRLVFSLGTEVKPSRAAVCSGIDIPAKRCDRAEVSASRSLGAILKPSKKSRTYAKRASNSGPVSSALTSGPFSVPSKRLTCLVILPPINSATSSKSFLVSDLNFCTSSGITVAGFKLLKNAVSGFIGALASPISIILARSGSTIGSISVAAAAVPGGALNSNSAGAWVFSL